MNIYVGNLSQETTEAMIRALFEPYGIVKAVRVMKDRETGTPRGFAFVEMPDEAAAQQAIGGLDYREFQDRRIRVNEAKAKTPRVYNSFSSPFGYKNRFDKY